MKLTFRWYGPDDPVTLAQIRQIPTVSGIVSAVYDTPPGSVWSEESIRAVRDAAAQNGLAFEVDESVTVPEASVPISTRAHRSLLLFSSSL